MASRLFQEVREERGLAYAVQSQTSAYADSGALVIYCGTAPKRARETLGVIDDVVASLLADGITDTELAVAAGYLEGSLLLSLDDSAGRMGRLGRSMVHRDRTTPVDELVDRHPLGHHRRRAPACCARCSASPACSSAVGPFEADALVSAF